MAVLTDFESRYTIPISHCICSFIFYFLMCFCPRWASKKFSKVITLPLRFSATGISNCCPFAWGLGPRCTWAVA